MTISNIVAIYAAVISTVLGYIQIRQYLRQRETLYIEDTISIDAEGNGYYEVVISNRGVMSTTVLEIFWAEYVRKPWRITWEPDASISAKVKEPKNKKIPCKLAPGDHLRLEIAHKELFDLRCGFSPDRIKGLIRSEFRWLEIIHTQSPGVLSRRLKHKLIRPVSK